MAGSPTRHRGGRGENSAGDGKNSGGLHFLVVKTKDSIRNASLCVMDVRAWSVGCDRAGEDGEKNKLRPLLEQVNGFYKLLKTGTKLRSPRPRGLLDSQNRTTSFLTEELVPARENIRKDM